MPVQLPPITNPRFRFRRGALDPPGIALTDDDFLVVRVTSGGVHNESAAPNNPIPLEARARILSSRLTWEDQRVLFSIPLGADSITFERRMPLLHGFLQGAWAGVPIAGLRVTGDLLQHGLCYVQLGIGKGESTTSYIHTLLAAGYVGDGQSVGYPGGPTEAERQGLGAVARVRSPATVPGAEAFINNSFVSGYWRIQSLVLTLTTSAAVGNRHVGFFVVDSTLASIYAKFAPAVQAPSTVHTYILSDAIEKVTAAFNTQEVNWPTGVWIKPGDTWGTFTQGFAAGDLWSAVTGHVEAFI